MTMHEYGETAVPLKLEEIHYRLLSLIYRQPDGISMRELLRELKERGWCEAGLTAEDLGYRPEDVLRRPRAPANEP